ncbi:MAG TPA: PDZ domain-containing protein [Tepidisphaeraceae bacterium]|nr:PDZ domain-containing protein [Tepidisphaeraceae bacterium]
MRLSLSLASVLFSLAATLAHADPLDDTAANPPATGALVIRVQPDGPAQQAGVRPGDVVTRYAGAPMTGMEDLTAAVTANAKAKGKLDLTYVRGAGQPVTVQLPPGKLGLGVVGVQQGKPLQLRPPATDAGFDLAAYKAAPRDEWYAVHGGGAHVGFQHDRVEVKGDTVVVTTEYAIAGAGGPRHYLVTLTATTEPRPKLIEARYVAPLDRASVCTLTPTGNGKLLVKISEDGKTRERTLDLPADAMHENLALQLAAAMPMRAGACAHFRSTTLFGEPADPSAVSVGEPAQIDADGAKVTATPVTIFGLAKKGATAWVDPATRTVVKFDYPNGATATRTTRDKALAGINPKLKPQS